MPRAAEEPIGRPIVQRGMRHALLLLVTLAACDEPTAIRAETMPDVAPEAPAPSALKASPFDGTTTASLALSPEVEELVEALAEFPRVESAHVGAGGVPSEAHAAFTALAAKVNPNQAVALLRHESAVVRAYMTQHVATLPDQATEVEALFADTTEVGTLEGCMMGGATVGEVALEAVCTAAQKHAKAPVGATNEAILTRVSRDASSPHRRAATRCLTYL